MGKVVGAAFLSHHPDLMQNEEIRRAVGAGEDSDLIEGYKKVREKLKH